MIRIMQNTMKILLKRKGFLITTFLLPIILIFVFTGMNGEGTGLKLAVINEDKGEFGREVEDRLSKLNGVAIVDIDSKDYIQDLVYHKFEMVITIDKDFTESIIRGEKNEITYEVLIGNDREAIIKGFLESEVSSLARISNNMDVKKEGIDKVLNTYRESMPQYEVLNSKDRKPNILVSLGLIFYLLFITAAGSCGFILEDERQGTRERILMGRISERKYYISQCITFFIFTAVPSIEYYAICKIFHYEFGFNNTILLLIFALLMSLLAVAFSIMVTSIIKSKSIFNLVNAALTVPIFMLSGAFWDYKMMSTSLQNVGDILPPRWIFMAIEKLQAGAEITAVFPVISGVIGLSILFLLLSVFFTRNKMVLVKEPN
jgi:ABC-2 type transport system permease protein